VSARWLLLAALGPAFGCDAAIFGPNPSRSDPTASPTASVTPEPLDDPRDDESDDAGVHHVSSSCAKSQTSAPNCTKSARITQKNEKGRPRTRGSGPATHE